MAFWAAAGAVAKKLVIAEATHQATEQAEDILWPAIGITFDALLTGFGAAAAIAIIGTINFDLASLLPNVPGISLMSATTGAAGTVDISQLDLSPATVGKKANGFDITSNFGYRIAPTAGATSDHDGVDVGAAVGTPVYAPAAGKVNCYGDPSPKYSKTSNAGGYGAFALEFISSDPNVPDFFIGHNSNCVSGTVTPGQVIGAIGNEGVSTGPHAHITQFDQNGKPTQPQIGFISLIMGAKPPVIASAVAGDDVFDIAYKFSSQWEGSGCSYHPADSGGLTCYGVAQNYSSSNVASLGAEGAKQEIKRRFWDDTNCGQYAPALAIVCLDTHLNFGSWDWLTSSTGLDAMAIVNGRKAYRYQRVDEAPSQEAFLQGWLNRDNDLEQYIQKYL